MSGYSVTLLVDEEGLFISNSRLRHPREKPHVLLSDGQTIVLPVARVGTQTPRCGSSLQAARRTTQLAKFFIYSYGTWRISS